MVYYEYNLYNRHYIYFEPVILYNEKGERVVPKIHNIAKYSKLWSIIMNIRKTEDYIVNIKVRDVVSDKNLFIPATIFDDEQTVDEMCEKFDYINYTFKKRESYVDAKIYTTSELFSQLAENIKTAIYTDFDYNTIKSLGLSLA